MRTGCCSCAQVRSWRSRGRPGQRRTALSAGRQRAPWSSRVGVEVGSVGVGSVRASGVGRKREDRVQESKKKGKEKRRSEGFVAQGIYNHTCDRVRVDAG